MKKIIQFLGINLLGVFTLTVLAFLGLILTDIFWKGASAVDFSLFLIIRKKG